MREKTLYARLAWTGMRKNRRLYLPYLLSCAGMVLMFYILMGLSGSEVLGHMSGGTSSAIILRLGTVVIAVFALIFLFYTHSFLIRRREREFGLYNVLGMGKGSIARILLWETAITYGLTTGTGLLLGVVLYKLAELGMVRLLRVPVTYTLTVSVSSLLAAAALFAVIHTLILLNSLRQLHGVSAVALLRSESVGEKPPRAQWVLTAAGVVLLGGAYALALAIKEPLAAFLWFFAAVIMVIIATYLLFISGSVTLCRGLQRNKKYYYRPQHFVSVASMTYRMKRNGAGLASVCILATMVLVMISSTTCLYVMKREIPALVGAAVADITPSLTVVVPDFEQFVPELQSYLTNKYGWYPTATWHYAFDTDLPENQQGNIDGVTPNLKDALDDYLAGVSSDWDVGVSVESKAANRADFYGTYGGLFFLGIMLSIVFIFAAVAILYYKQLSEGYEDQSRFDIMQKVGMTKQDIRRSINSQLLTVFYLPLLMAGVHLCFAFPFIHKLLILFNLDNRGLLIGTTAVSFAVFAVLYAIVYKLTGNTYYRIVAEDTEKE